MVKFIIAKLHH